MNFHKKILQKFSGGTLIWFSAFVLLLIIFVLTIRQYDRELNSDIVFGWSKVDFLDNGSNSVVAVGRLSGNGIKNAVEYGFVYSTNNSTFISCDQSSNQCLSCGIEQVGNKQTSELTTPYIYPVISWTPSLIVASDGGDPISCTKTTVNLDRIHKVAEWVQEPFNQENIDCKNSDNKTYKWVLEDPLQIN